MQTHNLLYTYTSQSKKGQGFFLAEHILWLTISGMMETNTPMGIERFSQGQVCIARKNQLVKATKKPDGIHPFRGIGIFLSEELLQAYSREHMLKAMPPYQGVASIRVPADRFIKSYFDSLLPYFDQPDQLTQTLAAAKTTEALALLLRTPSLKEFLFDFSEPAKPDLAAYMNRHFTYNIPLAQFARLTGRSLSTFKRDFKRIFQLPPEQWLKRQRLERAHVLLTQEHPRLLDVSWEVGFENFSHFSASFKAHFGYSPSQLTKHRLPHWGEQH